MDAGGEAAATRLGAPAEALRAAVSRWPFRLGRHRIPGVLGTLLRAGRDTPFTASGGGGVLLPFLAEDVAHPAFWGQYEPGVRAALRDSLRPGDVFVDLGAHRGFHAGFGLSLVGPGGLVVAVEPLPDNVRCLRRMADLNPGRRLVVVEAAVARAAGEADLHVSGHGMLSSTVIRHGPDADAGDLRVPAITLDDLWDRHVRGPAAGRAVTIKIDVEGAEEDALLGGPRALADRETLRAVVVECAGGPRPRPRERSAGVVRILREAGFGILALDPNAGTRAWTEADLDRSVYLLARR